MFELQNLLKKEMTRAEFLKISKQFGLGALGLSLAPSLLQGCVTASSAAPNDAANPASLEERAIVHYPKLAGQKIQSPEHYGLEGCMTGYFNGALLAGSSDSISTTEFALNQYNKKGISPSILMLEYRTSTLSEFGHFPPSAKVPAERGIIPFVTFDLRNSVGGKMKYDLTEIINSKADHIIKRIAKEAREFGEEYGGFFINTLQDMNGYDWMPWCNQSGKAKKTWKHIWQIFEDEGANKYATWVWSIFAPATGRKNYAAEADIYYPGDEFVDWIGMTGYNLSDTMGSFNNLFGYGYSRMHKSHPSKPIMIAATGSDNYSSKPDWVRETFNSVKNKYTGIKAINWWDMNWTHGRATCDSRIDSSPEALQAFKESIEDPYFLGKVPYRKDLQSELYLHRGMLRKEEPIILAAK